MKVKELFAFLKDMDPEATVLIMSQANWPFEYSVSRITTRASMLDEDEDEDDTEDESMTRDGMQPSDVFLVEGTQLRYGSRRAWQ